MYCTCAYCLSVLWQLPWGRYIAGTAAGCAAVLGLLVLPSGAWTLRHADLAAVYDTGARHALLSAQVPTRLAVAAVNAMAGAEPRVVFGGAPFGAFLRGTPIYSNWYNRPLYIALLNASDAQAAAVLDAQHPNFVIASPASSDPVEHRIVQYSEQRGMRIPLPGDIGLWRIAEPN